MRNPEPVRAMRLSGLAPYAKNRAGEASDKTPLENVKWILGARASRPQLSAQREQLR